MKIPENIIELIQNMKKICDENEYPYGFAPCRDLDPDVADELAEEVIDWVLSLGAAIDN